MMTTENFGPGGAFGSVPNANIFYVIGSFSGNISHGHDVVGVQGLFGHRSLAYLKEPRFPLEVPGENSELRRVLESFSVLPGNELLWKHAPEQSEEILQDWEGVVEAIDEDDNIFTAQLRDLETRETYPSKVAELPIDDISDDDQELFRTGAVFYLTVGYRRSDGRKERFIRTVFRRVPRWTQSDLERAEQRAQRITNFLDSES